MRASYYPLDQITPRRTLIVPWMEMDAITYAVKVYRHRTGIQLSVEPVWIARPVVLRVSLKAPGSLEAAA